ncbi:MAG: response regulator [Candidatus Polarisedimenticolia bacterium]
MKTVLLVDDEKVFLSSLKEGLQSFGKRLRVLTARDGKEAIGVLARTTVHLVVTDLNMPGVDGMALLAHMSRKHPKVPAIVMTAYGSPETEQKVNALGALRYIEKPIDFKETARLVFDVLELPTSYIRGIGVPSFAQLIEVERKTCIVRATSYETPPRTGVLHFVDGELVHAEIGALAGAEAAYEILAWGEASLELEELLGKAAERTIHAPLANLVMQSLVIADQKRSEAEAAAGEGAAAERPAYEAPKLEEEAPAAKETEAEPADDGAPDEGATLAIAEAAAGQVQEILANLRQLVPGTETLGLVAANGVAAQLLCAPGHDADEARERMAPLVFALVESAEMNAASFDKDRFRRVTVECGGGHVSAMRVNDQFYLFAVTSSRAKLGMIYSAMDATARSLALVL